jgi:hypothetical protein
MNQLTNETLPSLPSAWIDRLWQRFLLMYGNKFADMWRDLDPSAVKRAWGEDLAGYSADEMKRGLDWCKTQKWPPTLPEFMEACRPVLDPKTEWAEACEQMRIRLQGQGRDKWTRPEVYWAAVAIGWYDLNSTSWDQIKTRWTNALRDAKHDALPDYHAALPAPGKQTVTREEAKDRMAELKQAVEAVSLPGTTKANTKWAFALMKREAEGEQVETIAAQFWREALGYPNDMNAKTALQRLKAQEAA